VHHAQADNGCDAVAVAIQLLEGFSVAGEIGDDAFDQLEEVFVRNRQRSTVARKAADGSSPTSSDSALDKAALLLAPRRASAAGRPVADVVRVAHEGVHGNMASFCSRDSSTKE
jgi:hypothetical protein